PKANAPPAVIASTKTMNTRIRAICVSLPHHPDRREDRTDRNGRRVWKPVVLVRRFDLRRICLLGDEPRRAPDRVLQAPAMQRYDDRERASSQRRVEKGAEDRRRPEQRSDRGEQLHVARAGRAEEV